MERDPFYLQIVERLNQDLDEDMFQTCVGDLLGAIYPGLVPFKGGDDAGMDGAVPDMEGEPFPLIVTTGQDAIGNLTRNLKSYLSHNRRRKKALFATSKRLSPRKSQNLYDRAAKLGFNLVNVYQQEDIAKLLYRRPEWCRDLLGLNGNPAALSTIPKSIRHLLDQPITGRYQDYNWLKETRGDRLLVGQPGSGKTFMLYQFTKEDGALFAVSSDIGEIANSIRALQPVAIMIDDAHINQSLLVNLIHLRQEMGINFSIVASCWHGDKEQIATILNLSESRIRCLEQLTRDEIVKVINEAGLGGPTYLIRELVDQAEGRPGLAVTLARLCLLGDVKRVYSGKALVQSITQIFPEEIAIRVKLVLASFGLGGNKGMPISVLSNVLGFQPFEIIELISTIAPNGVIQEKSNSNISVNPTAFRQALINNVFFQNNLIRMSIVDSLIKNSSDIAETAITLVGVKRRGGNIPHDKLLSIVEQSDSDKVWIDFAWLGKDEVNWILQNYPEKFNLIIEPTLEYNPDKAIPFLLSKAIGDNRSLNSNPDHPIRVIGDWIKSGFEPAGEAVRRRKVLLQAIIGWVDAGGDFRIATHASCFVMSPKVEGQETDPGFGNRVTFLNGYLSHKDLNCIQLFWPEVLHLFSKIEIPIWEHISDIFWDWANPILSENKVVPQFDSMRIFAAKILSDFIPLIQNHPGIVQKMKNMALEIGVTISVENDLIFNILYPAEDCFINGSYEEQYELQLSRVEELKNKWEDRTADEIAAELRYLEDEAQLVGKNWPRNIPNLCEMFASSVNSPANWGMTFIRHDLPCDAIEPFLSKSTRINESGWEDLVKLCLETPSLIPAALNVILKLSNPSNDLLLKVVALPGHYSNMIETMCLRSEVSSQTVGYLLRSQNIEFARSAAYGEWLKDPKSSVHQELYSDWKEVILSDDNVDSHWLKDILKSHPEMGFEWIKRLLKNKPKDRRKYIDIISKISKGLVIEQKHQLLDLIKADYLGSQIVQCITKDSDEIYDHLLSIQELKEIHLIPLGFETRNRWLEKAIIALNYGHSPKDIASAVYGVGISGVSWIGKRSIKEKEYLVFFENLYEHHDSRIIEIGEYGVQISKKRVNEALSEERNEAIYGIGYSH